MKNILKTTILAIFLISLGSCETDTHPDFTANGFTLSAMVPSGPYVLGNGSKNHSTAVYFLVSKSNETFRVICWMV